MSYRAFKRLLGESNLERKCRFLLGTGILILITLSFWVYAKQTENLAYEQTTTSGRLLVPSIVAREHLSVETAQAIDAFQKVSEKTWTEALSDYKYKIIKPKAQKAEHKPEGDELSIVNRFISEPDRNEITSDTPSGGALYYYGAIRADASCLGCHQPKQADLKEGDLLKVGDLMAVVSIRLSTKAIETGFHVNRALLISTALLTAMLITAGSYLIIRYVIVKPVKHLKQVSDAIAAGHVNVRSEIQTGDEFEDLSHAFNRMLRNLMAMQESYQTLNADLDRKVDELARTNLALYESNRVKGDFLSTVSHELRTPLNGIIGFSDVLLTTGGILNEKQARWVINIKTNGQQLLNLINDILDLAKIEAGKMEVRPEEIDIAEWLEVIIPSFRLPADKKKIELRILLDSPLPRIRQDSVKLRQIISNLLSNAIKFTPEGGLITVKGFVQGNEFHLLVIDTGVGIATEDQELVFEKFRQSGNPLTREHEGTGLGLSIVRELCKLLGGEITLKSELGRGSTFEVTVPVEYQETPRIGFQMALDQLGLPNGRALESHLPPRIGVTASPSDNPLENPGVESGTNPVLTPTKD